MRVTLVFGIIALMMIETVIADEDICDIKEIEDCVTGFLRFFLYQFENIDTLPGEREGTCKEFMKNATCATSQPKYCKEKYPMLRDLLRAIENYNNRFCKDSEEKKLYLEQAPCLYQKKESFQECLKGIEVSKNGRVSVVFGCMDLEKMLVCLNETGNECGQPADELMVYLMEPLLKVYSVTDSTHTRVWSNLFECIEHAKDVIIDDSAVVCVFQNINDCYKSVGNLGADLTVELPKTHRELHQICSGNMAKKFDACVQKVVWTCNVDIGNGINIRHDVKHFCRNGSVYQEAFMNSTGCHNSYVPETRECYERYATEKSHDARALCCSVYKVKECTNFMTNRCSKDVEIQLFSDHNFTYTNTLPDPNLVHKYYEYADSICKRYYEQCDSYNSAHTVLKSNFFMCAAVSLLIFVMKTIDCKL